jgi:sulfite reductase alpha subunit-like flavoprotein
MRAVVDGSRMKYGPVNVYFASQTQTAEQFAHDLREEAKSRSILLNVINLKDLDVLGPLT